jgi:hypothetical protein
MANNQRNGEWPNGPRSTATLETPNGVVRATRSSVTGGSVDPGERTEKLPYRDTVTGRYRESE